MKLLGDIGLVENHFGLFGDGVCVIARMVIGLHKMYHRFQNCLGRTRWHS
jgi:hypothetical protein